MHLHPINSNVHPIPFIQAKHAKHKMQSIQHAGRNNKWITGKSMGWIQSVKRPSWKYLVITNYSK
jgi:hypothetical protein